MGVGTAAGDRGSFVNKFSGSQAPAPSGAFEFRDVNFGNALTECPQAGLLPSQPQPLDQRQKDAAERLSLGATLSDRRANQDYSCFPQNETSIDVNPNTASGLQNIVAGANDYRLGFGASGFYASTDGGDTWVDGILPFPSLPSGDNLDGGGDPAVVFDREGTVYHAQINFNRTDDTTGLFVFRSTNGGFTWSRPCVPIDTTPTNPIDDAGRCGGFSDPRQPGDGVITFIADDDALANSSIAFFDDKEYIAAGPRPAGVAPTCFGPFTGNPVTCAPGVVGPDRLYVSWSRFNFEDFDGDRIVSSSQINVSYSDDRGRSWSPAQVISGSADFCAFSFAGGRECDDNQFSVPTVSPVTGELFVAFQSFNTPAENQYLVVRSSDGGQTFQGPFFVTPVFDVNFPLAGIERPDCTARGQQRGRIVYTNSCFRSNAGGNIVVDKRGGAFADDLYLVMSDNRNGTRASSNADVFLFKSTNGGTTWVGPTRVNDDRSALGGVLRGCTLPRPAPAPARASDDPRCGDDFGNDQWWPWVDISQKGDVNVIFHDRRLDTASVASEWPGSRQRPGNYLVWTWGAQCTVTTADSRQCVAPEATESTDPTGACQTDPPRLGCVAPGPGSVPGNSQSTFPYRNFQVSTVPSNFDYSFRAGIFAGDYNGLAVDDQLSNPRAFAFYTDARNGRSSGGPTGRPVSAATVPSQPGRNPSCEQSDVFVSSFLAEAGGRGGVAQPTDSLFLVTPCPVDALFPATR